MPRQFAGKYGGRPWSQIGQRGYRESTRTREANFGHDREYVRVLPLVCQCLLPRHKAVRPEDALLGQQPLRFCHEPRFKAKRNEKQSLADQRQRRAWSVGTFACLKDLIIPASIPIKKATAEIILKPRDTPAR